MDKVTSLKDMQTMAKRVARSGWLWTAVYTTLCGLAVACGGAQKGGGNQYQSSISTQRACCGKLADPSERAACIDQIVTVEDEEVQSSPANQATFRCMNDNFTCDPSTGQATPQSRQAQLDCINDIGQE